MTYNIDPIKIRKYLDANGSRVMGLMPVHLYGLACDMDAIQQLAQEFNLFVLEDIAQAFGGRWNGVKLGSLGTMGAFSFFPSKNLGGFGDGGLIATNDDEGADLVRMLLKHGGKDKYNVDHIGYNARLDTLQAAVLLAKFKYIDEFNQKRRRIADWYNQGLQDCKWIRSPSVRSTPSGPQETVSNNHHIYHQYTIGTNRRDDLQIFLKERGVATMVYYPVPLHRMEVFKGRAVADCDLKEAERATQEVLSLPIEPLMSDDDLQYVLDMMRRFSA
jgi:UDP-2-acetamido-2-deoxy-ribo-hexuluronate aminotransferase